MSRRSNTGLTVFFFLTSYVTVVAQETVKDTVRTETGIEGVSIRANTNKKSETALLQEQKKAIIQKQSVGSEEISRKGISNLEQGLTKITGINTVESRGLFVRGLEERYNTLLVNGLGTPSNNPFQKIIELKQFPTDIVAKFDVFKTYNANLYGDFAGATFDVETLVPDRQFNKIDLSAGINTVSTFRKNFKIAENANTLNGYFGLNSDNRRLPGEVNGYRPSGKIIPHSSFGDSWNVDNITTAPNTSIGFTTSQKFRLDGSSTLSLLFNLSQGSEYEYSEGSDNTFDTGGVYKNKLTKREYDYNIQSTALLGLAYKRNTTKVDLVGTYIQNSFNRIQDYDGYRDNKNEDIMFFRTNQQDISRLTDVQLILNQKINERNHFKAGGSWVNNWFEQPDRKTFYGFRTGDNQLNLSYGGNNLIRQYLTLNGANYFSGMAEYNLFLGDNDSGFFPWTVTLGYSGYADKRDMSYRFIFSTANTSAQQTIDIDTPDAAFAQANEIGTFSFKESDQPNYKAFLYQFVNGGYATLNYKPDSTWDILLGARTENNLAITRYKEISDNINGSFRTLNKNQYYFLPSLSVKKSLENNQNIRFAASKTITRPILIETLPIEYINPDNNSILGNYDKPNATFGEDFRGLDNSQNYNIDLKYEIFPSRGQLFAVNVFGKKIDRAIERSFISSGNSNGTTTTFFNAKSAILLGTELEAVVNLNTISPALNNFSLGTNATFLYSDVNRSAAQSEETDYKAGRKRTLQGAAPWMLNADLKYDFKNAENLKRTASLVYNVSGKKIYGVGFGSLDNVYEMPFHQVDFILQSELTKKVDVKLGIYNILNDTYRLEMGDRSTVTIYEDSLLMENNKRGTSFNLSVGYKF